MPYQKDFLTDSQITIGTFEIGVRYFFPEPDFAGLVLESISLSDGRCMDLLTDSDGNFLTEKNEIVKRIEKEYNKHFIPGSIYGYPCLLHLLN